MNEKKDLDSLQKKALFDLERQFKATINPSSKHDSEMGLKIEDNNVVELWISLQENRELSDSIGNLKHLKTLELNDDQLTELPTSIGELTSLEFLELNCNQITTLPDSIGSLINLKELFMYYNQLSELPKSFRNLHSLQVIHCANNNFSKIPEEIFNLRSLKVLNFARNNLSIIPDKIQSLKNLKELDLSENNFTEFPQSISKLKNLEKLKFERNKLEAIPESIENANSLIYLDLGENKFSQFPHAITKLKNLKELKFRRNELKDLPSSIKNLSSLNDLDLSSNHFNEFPDVLSELKNLISLSLGKNQISSLPLTLTKLKALKHIYLWDNKFKSFPSVLCDLLTLETIRIDFNAIDHMPKCLTKLTNLKHLNITNNPFFERMKPLTKETLEIFTILDKNGTDIYRWKEGFVMKNLKMEYNAKKSNILNNKNYQFVSIRCDFLAIDFFLEFHNLGRHLQSEYIPGMPEFKDNSIKNSRFNLIDTFKRFQARGLLRGKSTEIITNITKSEETIEMITELGGEFSIKFDPTRVQKVVFDIWDTRKHEEVILPYDQVYIIPNTEIFDYSWLPQGPLNTPFPDHMSDFSHPKQLFITQNEGVNTRELLDIFKFILPDYGDFNHFETIDYLWDYSGIPVYFLFIGS